MKTTETIFNIVLVAEHIKGEKDGKPYDFVAYHLESNNPKTEKTVKIPIKVEDWRMKRYLDKTMRNLPFYDDFRKDVNNGK